MNKYRLLFVITFFILLGCPEQPEYPPKAPVLVTKSAPDDIAELGIDVEILESEQSIVLMWHPNEESDLAGYKIYRNADIKDSSFREIKDIIKATSLTAIDTLFYDEDVKERTEYYYFIKAYNAAKEKSEPSDTVRYTFGNEPIIISPDDNIVQNDTLKFAWYDIPYGYLYSNEYVLRVQELDDNLITSDVVWIARFTNRWYGAQADEPLVVDYFLPTLPYPGAPGHIISCWGKYNLLPAGEYRWKVKAIIEFANNVDLDVYSSESTWTYFTVIDTD